MPFRHYQLVLGAAAQRLSQSLTIKEIGGAEDVPYRQVILSVSGADAYIGGPLVSTTDYGRLIDSATQDEMVIGPFDSGGIKLSEIWAVGSGSTIHIAGMPF